MSLAKNDLLPLHSDESEGQPPKRARRADAVANRELILQTAETLFAAQGVENVKMMAIAEAAGIGQGTLYRAFANKGELCLALMDEDLRAFQEAMLILFRERHAQPALGLLEQFLDRLIHFLDSHAALMCEAQNYQLFSDEIGYTGLHVWFHQTVGLILQRALNEGHIRAECDVAYATDAILAPLNPMLFTHHRRNLGMEVTQISRELRKLVLQGIKAEG